MEYCRYSCIMVVVVVIVVVVVVVVVLWWLLWLLLLYYDQPVLSECFVFPITYRYYGPGKTLPGFVRRSSANTRVRYFLPRCRQNP
jgi:hypothetical protein